MATMYQGQEAEKTGRIVDEVITAAPLLNYLDHRICKANTIEGWRSKNVGLFGPRPYGFGAKNIKSDYERYTASMFNYDGKLTVENALLESQANMGIPAGDFLAREGTKILKGGLVLLNKVLWYGTDLMSYVSPGIRQIIAPFMTVSAKTTYQSFDTSDKSVLASKDYKAACADNSGTSVYFIVKANKGLEVLWGNGRGIRRGSLKDIEVPAEAVDGTPGSFEGKVQHFTATMGLLNNELYYIGRLKNITSDTGLTDKMIIKAKAEIFDAFDVEPTAVFMNKAARSMLRESRYDSADYVDGVSPNTRYAKLPTEVDGIPIIVDNCILNDESKESLAADGKKTLLSVQGVARLEK